MLTGSRRGSRPRAHRIGVLETGHRGALWCAARSRDGRAGGRRARPIPAAQRGRTRRVPAAVGSQVRLPATRGHAASPEEPAGLTRGLRSAACPRPHRPFAAPGGPYGARGRGGVPIDPSSGARVGGPPPRGARCRRPGGRLRRRDGTGAALAVRGLWRAGDRGDELRLSGRELVGWSAARSVRRRGDPIRPTRRGRARRPARTRRGRCQLRRDLARRGEVNCARFSWSARPAWWLEYITPREADRAVLPVDPLRGGPSGSLWRSRGARGIGIRCSPITWTTTRPSPRFVRSRTSWSWLGARRALLRSSPTRRRHDHGQKLDLREFDALLVASEGLGDFITFRNHAKPVACVCSRRPGPCTTASTADVAGASSGARWPLVLSRWSTPG